MSLVLKRGQMHCSWEVTVDTTVDGETGSIEFLCTVPAEPRCLHSTVFGWRPHIVRNHLPSLHNFLL